MSVPILSRSSRMNFTTYVVDELGYDFFNLLDLPEIPEQIDDISYVVKGFDRIDLLANTHYGDPTLWWVIAVANDMELVPTDLIEGNTIKIPSPRYVAQELFTKKALTHG